MRRALLLCAALAFAGTASATSFGSTTNASDEIGTFSLDGTGTETFAIDFAPGSYVLDVGYLVQSSLYGKIDSVSFDGHSFTELSSGLYDTINYSFTVGGAGKVLDFVIDTSPTKEYYFVTGDRPHTMDIKSRMTDPSYLGAAIFTDVGTSRVSAVPEPAPVGMMLAGLLGLGFLASRRKGQTTSV